MNISEKVEELLGEVISNLGITLTGVEYVNENKINYLRVYIDKEPFITVDDCVLVTNKINPILDTTDITSDSYILDVCSTTKGGNLYE